MEVARGIKPFVPIYGSNYPTKDGTGVRDYIHIMDLAEAHAIALEYLIGSDGFNIFNLGTGKGTTVLELINTFENVTNSKIPIIIKKRRSGDTPSCFADPSKAKNILKWKTKSGLDEMCLSAYNFSKKMNG